MPFLTHPLVTHFLMSHSFVHDHFLFVVTVNTPLEDSSVDILLARECVMIVTTVAWALLPARIARLLY